MNKLILMGRLTRNPDIRYSQGAESTVIANFSIAVDRKYARQNDEVKTDFFSCVAFGKQAEFVEKYLQQGTKMLVTGRVQNNNYTNRDGQKVYSVQVLVEELEFAESKSSNGNNSNSGSSNNATDANGFMNIPTGLEEELPFN